MRLHPLITFLTLAMLSVPLAGGQDKEKIAHGTLITAMGNKAGIVVMTDSRVTYTDAQGHLTPDPAHPVQKLMRYDDRTVCATAGTLTIPPSMFRKTGDSILQKLDTQVPGLIQFYRDAIKKKGRPQSMSDTIEGLSGVIRNDFQILSDVNSSVDPSFDYDYHLELFLAGFDLDDKPKIGRIDILVKREFWPDGRQHMVAIEAPNDCKLRVIGDELNICSGGLDAVETAMRKHPEHYAKSPVIREFAETEKKDRGASFSIEQMKRLAHAFKHATVDARVGGPDQMAVITKENLELKAPNDLPSITAPRPFVVASCPPGYEIVLSTPLLEAPTPVLFQHCDFVSDSEEHYLDGHIYLKCKFRNAMLVYLGGDTIFGRITLLREVLSWSLDPMLVEDLTSLRTSPSASTLFMEDH
jgi:hypothetical protein